MSLHLLHAAADDREPSDVISAAVEHARKRAPTVRLSSEVLHEDAAAALVDKGRNAFALVLGSRGLGDLAEMLLGAVSLAVAARADCPVVVVRGGAEHRDGRFGNIVVGVEEGEGSGTALRFALREAHVRSCRLTAVHAWNPSSRAGTLDLVQRGLTGLETREDALWLDPVPLPTLSEYGFSLRYRGHWGGCAYGA